MCPVKEKKERKKPIQTLIKPSSNYKDNLKFPYMSKVLTKMSL